MKQALTVARNYNNKLVLEQEANLLSKFKNEYGMEIVIPDKDAFMENTKEVYKKNAEKWGEGVYEKIQNVGKEIYEVE